MANRKVGGQYFPGKFYLYRKERRGYAENAKKLQHKDWAMIHELLNRESSIVQP